MSDKASCDTFRIICGFNYMKGLDLGLHQLCDGWDHIPALCALISEQQVFLGVAQLGSELKWNPRLGR